MLGHPPALIFGVDRSDELGRILEGRIGRVDDRAGDQRGDGPVVAEPIAQLLLDHVPQHPLGLCPEDVKGILTHFVVRGRLQREQPDLRTVAVGHDEVVLLGDLGKRNAGFGDRGALVVH